MISILIPLYNTDPRQLVGALQKQIRSLEVPVELRLWDDGSDTQFRKIYQQIPLEDHTTFHEDACNAGRVAARRKLSQLARNAWLLYLDGDSVIIHENFLQRYVSCIRDSTQVVVGGRKYSEEKPPCEYMLHWKYGTVREGKWRDGLPGSRGFQTNNFLISKSLFEAIPDPPPLHGYGHEDTWLGMQLERRGARVEHIDNAVLHDVLYSSVQLKERALAAARNLHTIAAAPGGETLAAHSTLYRAYVRLKSQRLLAVFLVAYRLFSKAIEKKFLACDPNLRAFDVYRLQLLIKTAKEKSELNRKVIYGGKTVR